MIDKDKIILMTKVAQYEKNHLKKDGRITEYFIEDYIYVNNFKTRVSITVITLFFITVGTFRMLLDEIIFPTSIWHFINIYIMPYFYPWLIAIFLYTFISTLVYGSRYRKASRRMRTYKQYSRKLKEHQKQHSSDEGAADEI